MSQAAEHRWPVAAEQSGERLDKFIARRLGAPRNQVQQWIRDGRVRIAGAAGRSLKASTSLEAGEQILCSVPAPQPDTRVEAEQGPLEVLYHDPHVVAVDKPAGLAIHPGAGRQQGTLVHRLLHHFPDIALIGGQGRPGIVHRLDLDTTGVLIVARSQLAYQNLCAAFEQRLIRKTYLAIVHGVPAEARGTIEQPIGRHASDRKRMTVRPGGRPSRTHYQVESSLEKIASLLEIGLETGRTHQIRVHMKALGHPLIGDPVYGEARWRGAPRAHRRTLADFPRPALHAWRLSLEHPVDGQRLELEAPVPVDLSRLWLDLGGSWFT